MAAFFPYRFDRRFAVVWTCFLVKPDRDGVTATDDELLVTYGFLSARTPLSNVEGAHITQGYRWWTAVGGRLSLKDDGLTFGTNRDRGVCIHFREPIPKLLGLRPHPALTVTVADCEGLVALLGEAAPRA
jgi:hypothetical protein